MGRQPLIGITADADAERHVLARTFTDAVVRAGGIPVILPCVTQAVDRYLECCDGFLLSSGDDPDTSQWGVTLDSRAKPIDPGRQAFEWALLEALAAAPARPVLGICLGMQMMAIHAGGKLDQYLPDTLPTASHHWGCRSHRVSGTVGSGLVASNHRQAITDPGALRVVATAHDGLIEAVRADDRPFYLGVQWHPERTDDTALGIGVVRGLVEAAARHREAADAPRSVT